MKHLILILAAGILLSTSCMKDMTHLSKMKDVEGEYVLIGAKPYRIPEDEFALIKDAKIYNNRGKWVFEYTVPIMIGHEADNREIYKYHHLTQELEWNDTVKEYYFHKLTEKDTQNTEMFPDDIITTMKEGYILLKHRRHGHLTLTWERKK